MCVCERECAGEAHKINEKLNDRNARALKIDFREWKRRYAYNMQLLLICFVLFIINISYCQTSCCAALSLVAVLIVADSYATEAKMFQSSIPRLLLFLWLICLFLSSFSTIPFVHSNNDRKKIFAHFVNCTNRERNCQFVSYQRFLNLLSLRAYFSMVRFDLKLFSSFISYNLSKKFNKHENEKRTE